MNDAQLYAFRMVADRMIGRADWQWIGPHQSQRMFGITQERAEAYAARHGGTAQQMVEQPVKFNIEVSVSGGVTGHRVSLLKADGQVRTFDTQAEAEIVADDYRRSMNGPYATASFSARVVPTDGAR